MIRKYLHLGFFLYTLAALLSLLYVDKLSDYSQGLKADSLKTQQIFASLPDNSTQFVSEVWSEDARALILQNYFRYYGSELLPESEYLVQIADQYHLDFRLLPAIAMQESNLCKYIPADSYNCWGYGIYGDQVIRFPSYKAAIEQVARTISSDYHDQGLVTPDEMMPKYTPPSDGSWAAGVNLFMDILEKGGVPNS